MSQRERDARAAMREIIRVTCASQWHQEAGRLDYSMPSGEHIAKLANEVADAMAAERAKRAEAAAVPVSFAPAPAPDIAALQAENSKLLAVAEAAAEVAQGRSACLLDALDAAMPGWRTKETP